MHSKWQVWAGLGGGRSFGRVECLKGFSGHKTARFKHLPVDQVVCVYHGESASPGTSTPATSAVDAITERRESLVPVSLGTPRLTTMAILDQHTNKLDESLSSLHRSLSPHLAPTLHHPPRPRRSLFRNLRLFPSPSHVHLSAPTRRKHPSHRTTLTHQPLPRPPRPKIHPASPSPFRPCLSPSPCPSQLDLPPSSDVE